MLYSSNLRLSLTQVSLLENGSQMARLSQGQSYVVLFQPTTEFATYSAVSSEGAGVVRLSVGNLTNPGFGPDVNGDGFNSPIDALLIVNFLNSTSDQREVGAPQINVPTLADVNGDGIISPLDVLLVVNALNNRGGGLGEGEGEGGAGSFSFETSNARRVVAPSQVAQDAVFDFPPVDGPEIETVRGLQTRTENFYDFLQDANDEEERDEAVDLALADLSEVLGNF